jgi:hypothetical protein
MELYNHCFLAQHGLEHKINKTSPSGARLKFILQRSLNVDLRIPIHGMMGQFHYDKRLSLLLNLMAHSERWGYLDLDLTAAESIVSLQAVKEHLPRLSQLHLKLRSLSTNNFCVAPRLETVVIDNVHNSHSIQVNVPVPIQQLSSYDQACRGELITLLATFSLLVHLGIV